MKDLYLTMYQLKRNIQENYRHRIRRSVLTAQLNRGLDMKFEPRIAKDSVKSTANRHVDFGVSTAIKFSVVSQRIPSKKISL